MPLDKDALKKACEGADPSNGPSALIEAVNQAIPDSDFDITFEEKGWYRLGGVVSAEGKRISHNLEEWVETESGGDVMELVALYGEEGYIATSMSGNTLYLTAPTGPGLLDFIQLEIEQVQEVGDRLLFHPDQIPDTLEDVTDPMDVIAVEQKSLSKPHYEFKQYHHFADLAEELTSDYTGDPRFSRFLREWQESSASKKVRFSEHWAISVNPFLRDIGERRNEVKLYSPHADAIHAYDMSGMGKSGPIIKMLESLDAEAGFPMAWFFLVLTKKFMSYAMVKSIHEEMDWSRAGKTFLAENDRRILENWIEDPYSL